MTDPAFLLDTNICIYLLGGSAPRLRERVESHSPGELVTSSIIAAEVWKGCADGDALDAASHLFRSVNVVAFDADAALAYANLPFRRTGFDRLIAAHALALDLTLVTNNERDFHDVPDLRIENWTR